MQLESRSPAETEALGEALGARLESGDLVGLLGELGSGKTCFVRGLARGLGIDPGDVSSPSFTIVAEHRSGRLPLYHIDLFRLDTAGSDELWLREYLYGDGVAVVEWFDRLSREAREEALTVTLRHAGRNRRVLAFAARGSRYERLLASLFPGAGGPAREVANGPGGPEVRR